MAVVAALYGVLVVIASLAFYFLRQGVPDGSPVRYAFALCGPALSLFTHMSYLLFAFQTLLVLPWLLVGAASKQARGVSAAGFVVSWLSIGWYMHDLF